MDPDSDPDWILLFSSVAEKMATKNKFLSKVFCLLPFEGTFTSAFKAKSQKEVKKIFKIMVFLFFLVNERIRIRTNNSGS